MWNAYEFPGNIWNTVQGKGQLHEDELERVRGSARRSCSWNNGERGRLRLPSGRMILAISGHFLLSSLCPSTIDHIDPWDDWQEQEGKPASGRIVCAVSQTTRADQPHGDDLMLPVGVTTDRNLEAHRRPGTTGWMEKGWEAINYSLFYLCIFYCISKQAVKRFLKQECKCHGVSGSCTLRTCWLAMADFRKTGDYLWKKYNGAIQVVMNQDGTGFTVANKKFKKPTKNDLVYFESSPDYCIRDRDVGKPLSLHMNGFI